MGEIRLQMIDSHISSHWWQELVKYFVNVGNSLEIRCWKEESEEIQQALQYGNLTEANYEVSITDIEPLLMAVYELLQESGIFVFATQHPCFVTLTEKYMTPHSYYDIAIEGQPEEQIYYHRSIQDIFNLCFRAGFVIDGFYEECFKTNKEIPMVMIVRLKKVKRDSLK